MSGAGRPLRFLVGVLGAWIGMRTAQLWQVEEVALVATAAAAAPVQPRAAPRRIADTAPPLHRLAAFPPLHPRPAPPSARLRPSAKSPVVSLPAIGAAPPEGARPGAMPSAGAPVFVAAPLPPAAAPGKRLAASLWFIARAGQVTPFAPQLGGSQTGLRVTYTIDDARRLSLAARLSTAFARRQTEAAVGLDWQPTRLPVHIVAEQRIGVDRARGGPALAVIAGIGPAPIAGRLHVEGYVQGGAVARDGVEGFVDGAVRVGQPVAAIGPGELELGLAAWGAAQRDASRLDLGPAAALVLPVAGRSVRLSLEWRERLAGNARPASGVAVSLGTDF